MSETIDINVNTVKGRLSDRIAKLNKHFLLSTYFLLHDNLYERRPGFSIISPLDYWKNSVQVKMYAYVC